ncbi:unnamed protein product [Arabis nemorensis]|uniref:F-box associated beta-propeller type 3 domain-containing protein n=1 Tax=Arabis nemorensis TaxID=586526 RepID=A0A565CLU8_9BRAS|nr:unnamed protein product [Arabis nemorensis]
MCGHPKESSQYQVFTLGAKQKSWRMIECSIPHRPWSNGVCIDGVVYYVADTGPELSQLSLMRFDVKSEKLDLITGVSADIVSKVVYGDIFVLNYEGKVAIPFRTTSYTFDVWVLDQDAKKHKWMKKLSFSIEPWKNLFPFINELWKTLSIIGITQTGEFILAPLMYSSGEVYFVHYNHNREFKKN